MLGYFLVHPVCTELAKLHRHKRAHMPAAEAVMRGESKRKRRTLSNGIYGKNMKISGALVPPAPLAAPLHMLYIRPTIHVYYYTRFFIYIKFGKVCHVERWNDLHKSRLRSLFIIQSYFIYGLYAGRSQAVE